MWEVFAYHNSAALFGTFNAIAAIMASGSYLQSAAVVGFVGFVAALFAYAFAPEKLQGWKWLGTVVLVYGMLFVPRVSVGIVDKTGSGPVLKVDNVPYGLALLGGLTSTIGNTLTESFETAFQMLPGTAALPAELGYQQHGLMFGSRLLQESRGVSLPDATVRTDLINFVANCTKYDIADGTISPDAFTKSSDLWSLIADTNPARFSIISSAAAVRTDTCPAVYASINQRLPVQLDGIAERLGVRANPTMGTLAAKAAVAGQIDQAYIRTRISTASSTATDLIRQNAVINSINDAGSMDCQRSNDPSCMTLATGRATAIAQQNAAWINGAKISEEALPTVRNVAEGVIYAAFPLIVLMLFISSGKNALAVCMGYVTVLISIQLWPPLFAILNYFASLYAQQQAAAAGNIGGGVSALTLQTASPIYSASLSSQAVVSYLIIGIPALAWSLSNKLVNFGSQLTGGLAPLQTTIGNQSGAAAAGNVSMGMVSMDQHTVSPMTSNPFVSRQQNDAGDWLTRDGNGRTAIQFLQNSGAASRVVSARAVQSASKEASHAAEAALGEAVSAGRERGAALSDAVTHANSRSGGWRGSSGASSSSSQEVSQGLQEMDNISSQISATTGIGKNQVQQIMFGAGLSLPFGLVNGGTSKNYATRLNDDEQKVLGALSTEQRSKIRQFSDRASTDQGFMSYLSNESRSGSETAARLMDTTRRAESAQRSYGEKQGYAERLNRIAESSIGDSIDLAKLPENAAFLSRFLENAKRYGSTNPQALEASMWSDIVQYGQKPTRMFADGTVAPSNFGDVKSRYEASSRDGAVNPNVAGQHARNARRIPAPSAPRSGTSGEPPVPQSRANVRPRPGGDDVRSEVQTRGDVVSKQAKKEEDSFADKYGLERGRDGTLRTRRSLAGMTAQTVNEDMKDVTVENALKKAYGKGPQADGPLKGPSLLEQLLPSKKEK